MLYPVLVCPFAPSLSAVLNHCSSLLCTITSQKSDITQTTGNCVAQAPCISHHESATAATHALATETEEVASSLLLFSSLLVPAASSASKSDRPCCCGCNCTSAEAVAAVTACCAAYCSSTCAALLPSAALPLPSTADAAPAGAALSPKNAVTAMSDRRCGKRSVRTCSGRQLAGHPSMLAPQQVMVAQDKGSTTSSSPRPAQTSCGTNANNHMAKPGRHATS